MKVGDRVVVTEACSVTRLRGFKGVITDDRFYFGGFMVRLDQQIAERFFKTTSLEKEVPMNIKQTVTDVVAALLPKTNTDRDAAARELLVAQTLATKAEARKKKAKEEALKVGLVDKDYEPGEFEAYRSAAFVVTTKTSEPSTRLDPDALQRNLRLAGLSQSKITKAISDSTFANKAATKIEVTEL